MQNAVAQDYRPQTLPKILLVEDFDDTRLMMKMWLEKRGYLRHRSRNRRKSHHLGTTGSAGSNHHGCNDARNEWA
jgi:response regulator RpfG family c-di-GMP phosphodiesterase